MAKRAIKVGMRVVTFPRRWGFEGTVLELAYQYSEAPPSYVKIRFDSAFLRTRWIDADYVTPIDGVIPSEPSSGGSNG